MPMFGSSNRDRVNVFLFENPAKVFLRHRSLAHLLLCALGELLENNAIHIADMRDAGAAPVRLERREMSIGAAVKANNGKVEAVIRTKYLAIALRRTSHSQPRRPYGKYIEKLASRNHRFSL